MRYSRCCGRFFSSEWTQRSITKSVIRFLTAIRKHPTGANSDTVSTVAYTAEKARRPSNPHDCFRRRRAFWTSTSALSDGFAHAVPRRRIIRCQHPWLRLLPRRLSAMLLMLLRPPSLGCADIQVHEYSSTWLCQKKWSKSFDKKAASPPHTDGSIVFAGWRQSALPPNKPACCLGPTRAHIPNGILIGSAIFAGLTIMTDRQTDRQTTPRL